MKKRSFFVCAITINSDQPQIRIEGDYVPQFYQELKRLVPWTRWRYVPDGHFWLVDKMYYDRIHDLAGNHFDRIDQFTDGRPEIAFTERGH